MTEKFSDTKFPDTVGNVNKTSQNALDRRRELPVNQPTLSMLPLDSPVIDYGTIPAFLADRDPKETWESSLLEEYCGTDGSPTGLLRRRILEGSRLTKTLGKPIEALTLFRGDVQASPPSSSGLPSNSYDHDTEPLLMTFANKKHTKVPGLPNHFVKGYIEDERGVRWSDLMVNPKQGWNSTLVCVPTVGNLHRFEAISDIVLILDFISPIYESPIQRGCQYFLSLGTNVMQVDNTDRSSQHPKREKKKDQGDSYRVDRQISEKQHEDASYPLTAINLKALGTADYMSQNDCNESLSLSHSSFIRASVTAEAVEWIVPVHSRVGSPDAFVQFRHTKPHVDLRMSRR